MQSSNRPSLMVPAGYNCSDCGYCKTDDSSASYYVSCARLSVGHYLELLDRGWRRSGSLLYLPDTVRACCAHYTIRLPASEYKPTRDQRQALNRWNRFVLGDEYLKESSKKFPKTKEESKRLNNTFDLQATIHESEQSYLKPGIASEHRFTADLEFDVYTDEKYALFEDYQKHVHHEADSDISKSGFKRFLCGSPLRPETSADGKRYGTFHQCYRLDGRLVAMGVLDLLPHAVSGVYFIYHHDMEKWSFGKLSAMREVALALEGGYQYYYMGFYIHSCKKMRYKGDYKPQYVLDLYTYEWNVMDDELKALMVPGKFASKSREAKRRLREPAATSNGDPEESHGVSDEADDQFEFKTPAEAMASGHSLLQMSMPGVLSLDALQSQIDLNRIKVYLGHGRGIHEVQDLQSWAPGDLTNARSLEGMFAEYAAAVGPVIAREAAIDLTR